MKKWHYPFLAFLLIGTILILSEKRSKYRTDVGEIFGTKYKITYYHSTTLHNKIQKRLYQVDNSLSMFNDSSIVSIINRNGKIRPDSMFTQVFSLAKSISTLTDGAFDITVAPLVNAWGFGFEEACNITPDVIDSIMSFVGYELVELLDGEIVKSDPRITLDFSAIAKGFGVDMTASLLEDEGVYNYMVEIGGEIALKGVNAKGETWKIGINTPEIDSIEINNGLQAIMTLSDKCMATSGNYRNYYYKDGRKIAHTIDPRTGYPAEQNLLSATVITSNCAIADAYATAMMVMGLEEALSFLQKHQEVDAYLIYSDSLGNILTTFTPNTQSYLFEEF
ncbi:MAG TPA: FAD:protein FMN transferase [Bacteroidaceae bacterium]|nr:FAD:protein FMN transferase [Bacteroidaceae bacterium]